MPEVDYGFVKALSKRHLPDPGRWRFPCEIH